MASKMDELKRFSISNNIALPLTSVHVIIIRNDRGIVRRNSMWDYLIFNKVQKSLGGRVRFILTGSAPISNKVLNFLRCAFGCMVNKYIHNLLFVGGLFASLTIAYSPQP